MTFLLAIYSGGLFIILDLINNQHHPECHVRPKLHFGVRVMRRIQLMEVPFFKMWLHSFLSNTILQAFVDPGKLELSLSDVEGVLGSPSPEPCSALYGELGGWFEWSLGGLVSWADWLDGWVGLLVRLLRVVGWFWWWVRLGSGLGKIDVLRWSDG